MSASVKTKSIISHETAAKPVSKDELKAVSTLNKDIDALCGGLKKSSESIHAMIKRCIKHAEKYGDTGPTFRLVKGISEAEPMYAVNVLRAFIMNNSPIVFTYAADDKKRERPTNAKIEKDKNGDYKVPFASEEKLEAAVVSVVLEQQSRGRTQREPQPFSIAWVKGQLERLETQLKSSILPDGRGFLVKAEGADKVIAHDIADPIAKARYEQYLKYIRNLKDEADKVSDLMAMPSTATELPKATPENSNPKVDKTPRVIKAGQSLTDTHAEGKAKNKPVFKAPAGTVAPSVQSNRQASASAAA